MSENTDKQDKLQKQLDKKILKDKLKYNPMGGLILEVVINNDDTLIINMTVQEEDSGEYTVAASGMPKKLTRLIRGESDGY